MKPLDPFNLPMTFANGLDKYDGWRVKMKDGRVGDCSFRWAAEMGELDLTGAVVPTLDITLDDGTSVHVDSHEDIEHVIKPT